MSAPRCAVCHDSGSKNQTGDYLDCPACDMPHTRKALNDFVKSLGPTHPEDVALAIHQRALAMGISASVEDTLNEMQPGGALHMPQEPAGYVFGSQYWEAGTLRLTDEIKRLGTPLYEHAIPVLAMAPKQEAQEPVAEVSAMPGTSGFTMAVFKADDMPIGSKVYAAPAAANGAQYLTRVADFLADAVGGYSGGLADRIEEVIKQLRLDAGCGACGDTCKGMTCRLQDESPSAVAAGSDAALVDAKHLVDITTAIMSQHGLIDHLSIGATQAFCDDLCAALSGAKGN